MPTLPTLKHTGTMDLATTVALPVTRGPIPLAKTIGAIDRLSEGRVVLVVGPGSSPKDYEIVGLDFDDRGREVDEFPNGLAAMWFYVTDDPSEQVRAFYADMARVTGRQSRTRWTSTLVFRCRS